MVFAPDNWPVAAPGFYLGYVAQGRVLLTLMGNACSSRSLETYFEAMQAGIDCMTQQSGIVSIHCIGAPAFWTEATLAERARHAKVLAALGERNKATLGSAFKYEVQVPTNSLARITLRLINTLVSLPYPVSVQPSLNDALIHLEKVGVGSAADVRRWRNETFAVAKMYASEFATADITANT